MMKKFWFLILMLLLATAPAMAILVEDGRTSQCWDFETETAPHGILPSSSSNVFGQPVAMISDMSPNRDLIWRDGAWYGSELKIIVDIPNQPIKNPYKLLYLDIVYQGNIVFNWVADAVSGDKFTLLNPDEQPIEQNGWMHLSQVWRFEPNPKEEIVVLGLKGDVTGAMAAINNLCIQTWCVPEPATLLIFAAGSVMASGLRKRVR